jgi:hypothetical protein
MAMQVLWTLQDAHSSENVTRSHAAPLAMRLYNPRILRLNV